MQEVCGRNAHASNGEPQLAKRSPLGEDLRVTSVQTANVRERRAWAAGIVFVLALVAETAISAGLPINQDDSAAKIAGALHDHRDALLVAAYLSIVYAVAFVIYLAKLHDLLRGVAQPSHVLHSLVLIGGVLLVGLHAVSDIGIYGLLGPAAEIRCTGRAADP